MESGAFPKWSIWRNEGSSGGRADFQRKAGASAPFTNRDERVRREASRAGAKSAQAGRGTEHPLVPVVWQMRLGTLLFCEAPAMTAAFADRLPCSI